MSDDLGLTRGRFDWDKMQASADHQLRTLPLPPVDGIYAVADKALDGLDQMIDRLGQTVATTTGGITVTVKMGFNPKVVAIEADQLPDDGAEIESAFLNALAAAQLAAIPREWRQWEALASALSTSSRD